MRRLLALPVVAALLAAGGCAGTSGTITAESTNAFVKEVQVLSVQACGFLPAAETIAGLATAGSAGATAPLALATSIAGVICGAVKTTATATASAADAPVAKSARRGFGTVHGVRIRGKFVR